MMVRIDTSFLLILCGLVQSTRVIDHVSSWMLPPKSSVPRSPTKYVGKERDVLVNYRTNKYFMFQCYNTRTKNTDDNNHANFPCKFDIDDHDHDRTQAVQIVDSLPVVCKESIPIQHQQRRRTVLRFPLLLLLSTASFSSINNQNANAVVQQAVGSGESKCRTNNNCLEVGEIDGAIGWEWGGKNRCDPSNPLCGPNGELLSKPITGQPVPTVPTVAAVNNEDGTTATSTTTTPIRFTHLAAIQIEIGRGEISVLKMGLYGNDVPITLISQLVQFLSESGFDVSSTNNSAKNNNYIGQKQSPVSLSQGGVVASITPNTLIELGVPSQSIAYAKRLGRAKVDESFIPQPRPPSATSSSNIKAIRPHDCAGLISMPEKGLGYGGTGFESDDECYESAFLITARAVPEFDTNSNKRRIVVGQIVDADSMAFLERLANLPTKRGIRGVIPGQISGPPLLKVVVRQIQISSLSS